MDEAGNEVMEDVVAMVTAFCAPAHWIL